ncbi:MAG: hypothetical protein M3144_03230 [Actinomycetota bacterium]|nr:hypothetical protein [Actinomycetota bacterium]
MLRKASPRAKTSDIRPIKPNQRDPHPADPNRVLELQRTAGNSAVSAALRLRKNTPDVERLLGPEVDHGARYEPVQRKEGDPHKASIAVSANEFDRDVRTGLLPHQTAAVKKFVDTVRPVILKWESRRGTEHLEFPEASDVATAYREFRRFLARDETFYLAYREAGRQLSETPGLKHYAEEIRMFNHTALYNIKDLLGLEEPQRVHTYEIKFVQQEKVERSRLPGTRIGLVARAAVIRYTNSAISDLSWTQTVSFEGFSIGLGVSAENVRTSRMGSAPKDRGPIATFSGSGEYAMSKGAPQTRYLSPTFFAGADWVRPNAPFSPGRRPGRGAMMTTSSLRLIQPDGSALFFEFGFNLILVGTSARGVAVPVEEAQGSIESGRTSLVGKAEWTKGKWPTPPKEGDADKRSYVLHFARIYFATGGHKLEISDVKALENVIEAIRVRDQMPGYEGSIFKMEIVGRYSNRWDKWDPEIHKLVGLKKRTTAQEKRLNRLLLEKDTDNDQLAYDRAVAVREYLRGNVPSKLAGRVHGSVVEVSELGAAEVQGPLGDDLFEDEQEHRAVDVTVSYRLFDPLNQASGGVRPWHPSWSE